LVQTSKASSLSGSSIEGSSIEGSSIHGDTIGAQQYKGKDPIKAYGQEVAALVLSTLRQEEAKGNRSLTLKKVLDGIDPGLYPSATAETKKFKQSGLSGGLAAQQGLAVAFSKGITQEFFNLGKGKKLKKGQLKLQQKHLSGLGGVTSTVSNLTSKIGTASCKVANNPLTPIAAGAATSVYGGGPQTGVAGTMVARSLCDSGAGAGYQMPPPKPATPSWVIPAAIGGGALLLVLVLKK
jgi:hypothetical protein